MLSNRATVGEYHTKEELEVMLTKMQRTSDDFYSAAFLIGCHPFLEWTGLLNEHIKICREALEAGIDFNETTVHSGKPLPMHPWEAAYLGEKFGCIFSSAFVGRPELLKTFLEAAKVHA